MNVLKRIHSIFRALPYTLPGINLQCTLTQQGQQHSLRTVTILQPIAFTLKTKLTNENSTTTFQTSKSNNMQIKSRF